MFLGHIETDFKDCTNIFSLIFLLFYNSKNYPVDPKIKRTVNPCRNNSKVKIFSFDNHFY